MRKTRLSTIVGLAVLTLTLSGFADKMKEDTVLKEFQPFGVKDKEHKHQAYDLTFEANGKAYTCRTDPKHSTNATDFVVGSPIHVEVDKQKVEIKTPQNKKVNCKVVRAEMIGAGPAVAR